MFVLSGFLQATQKELNGEEVSSDDLKVYLPSKYLSNLLL